MTKNKVCLVTGASGNLGGAVISRLLASGGWDIIATSQSGVMPVPITERNDRCFLTACDMNNHLQIREMLAKGIRFIGARPDAVVMCHGVSSRASSEILDIGEFRKVFDTNFVSCLVLAKALYPHMESCGWGRIVFSSSIHGQMTYPERLSYSVSKAALEAMARGLAVEWGGGGITINAVAPGQLTTPMKGAPIDTEFLDTVKQRTPSLKLPTPNQVAGTVQWLLSDDAGLVNGQTVRIDGGLGVSAWPERYGEE